MSRQVKRSFEAYEFRADFQPKPEATEVEAPAAERVNMDVAELAALLAAARAEGMAEALAQKEREETQRLQGVSRQLNGALANLVELAGHLEAASKDAALAEKSLLHINAAAKQIIDGQGDLFSELQTSCAERNELEMTQ